MLHECTFTSIEFLWNIEMILKWRNINRKILKVKDKLNLNCIKNKISSKSPAANEEIIFPVFDNHRMKFRLAMNWVRSGGIRLIPDSKALTNYMWLLLNILKTTIWAKNISHFFFMNSRIFIITTFLSKLREKICF